MVHTYPAADGCAAGASARCSFHCTDNVQLNAWWRENAHRENWGIMGSVVPIGFGVCFTRARWARKGWCVRFGGFQGVSTRQQFGWTTLRSCGGGGAYAVERDVEHGGVGVKHVLRAVAVVDVPVDDQHLFEPNLLRRARRHARVVAQAEPHDTGSLRLRCARKPKPNKHIALESVRCERMRARSVVLSPSRARCVLSTVSEGLHTRPTPVHLRHIRTLSLPYGVSGSQNDDFV